MTERDGHMQLGDYLEEIRARKSLVIIAVCIVTFVALGVSVLTPPTYVGEAKVLVTEQNTGAAIFGTSVSELANQPERGLTTQMQLIQTQPIAQSVVSTLGLGMSPEALLQKIEVQGVGQTNVLVIRATDGDPRTAAEIANAMGDAYVAWSKDTTRESIRTAAEEVESRLAETEATIARLSDELEAGDPQRPSEPG